MRGPGRGASHRQDSKLEVDEVEDQGENACKWGRRKAGPVLLLDKISGKRTSENSGRADGSDPAANEGTLKLQAEGSDIKGMQLLNGLSQKRAQFFCSLCAPVNYSESKWVTFLPSCEII